MDFVTHSLMGAGAARLAAPTRSMLPQLSLAAILGSLLQDGDSWLYLISPNHYGRYHRVASHSFIGLVLVGLLAGTLAWSVARVGKWRRFGWFVGDNLQQGEEIPAARWWLLAVTGIGAAHIHWCADAITGFGNVQPFWPWSTYDASLKAVMSFDVVIFVSTLAWHVTIRTLNWPRRKEAIVTAAYVLLIATYVAVRWKFGEPTFI